jgi:hypothetical protein
MIAFDPFEPWQEFAACAGVDIGQEREANVWRARVQGGSGPG